MRWLLLLLWGLLLPALVAAQAPFGRTLVAPTLGAGRIQLIATADGGSAIFSGDSLAVIKMSACGRAEWARRYRFPGLMALRAMHACTALADGGLAFVTRIEANAGSPPLVVRLDATGAVRWSQLVSAPGYEWYPYTLNEKASGDLVLYANLGAVGGGSSFNALVQLSPTGALRWARRYDLGVIWGGALVTGDGGILARTGNRFIKTDDTGAVQWTSSLMPGGNESYYAPVEVADGYVFLLGQNGPAPQVSVAKLDRQGQLATNARVLEVPRRSATLRVLPNGHPVVLVNPSGSTGAAYPGIIELTEALDVVLPPAGSQFPALAAHQAGLDLAVRSDGSALLVSPADGGALGSLMVSRTDAQRRFACDTAFTPVGTHGEPLTQTFITTNALPFSPTMVPVVAAITSFQVTQGVRCAAPLALDLGADTVLCGNASLRLRNRQASLFDSYQWSTGATSPEINVSAAGTYCVRVTANCGLDTLTDTIRIARSTVPMPARALDTVRCSDEPLWLDATVPGPATYRWTDGSTTPRYPAADTGAYTVSVRVEGCERTVVFRVSECERLVMPNVFTPGADDGFNDRFVPIEMRGIATARLEVYSRWGRQLFSTTDLRNGWSGVNNPAGTYFWRVGYTTYSSRAGTLKGWVVLAGD